VNAEPIHLEVFELAVQRGGKTLIAGLSFSLREGQQALIVGPNGSGKTSFLRMLAGLAPVTVGRITLAGTSLSRLEPAERASFLYQAHLDGFKKDLSIHENLEIMLGLRAQKATSQVAVLAELGLEALVDRPVKTLSAGQRRRAGLAFLKLGGARLWILDEPLTNLDDDGRAVVSRWLTAHLGEGGLAVVATHQPAQFAGPGTVLVEL
jgi:heme exporter protein A